MATINADVLIIGCGIAGGITALRLADAGVPVVIATRSQDPAESNTFWSQGGIIFEGQADTPERLAKDILAAGAGLSNPDAVKVLAENGPRLLEDVLINRLDDGMRGKFVVFEAKSIILATGGIGRAFKINSNSWECTGDGQGLAYLLGAELLDSEFMQFHPTGMVWPPSVRGTLITEGVRGEGGRGQEGEHGKAEEAHGRGGRNNGKLGD